MEAGIWLFSIAKNKNWKKITRFYIAHNKQFFKFVFTLLNKKKEEEEEKNEKQSMDFSLVDYNYRSESTRKKGR